MRTKVLPGGIYSNCASTFFVLEDDYVFIVPNDLILQQMQTKFLSNKIVNDFAKEYVQKGSYRYLMQALLYQLPITFFRDGYKKIRKITQRLDVGMNPVRSEKTIEYF